MRWSAAVCAVGLVTGACAPAGAQVFHSSAGDVVVETVAKGLDHPWALAFLPAGRTLVTERPGRMRIVAKDGALSPALGGVPKVFASGQGGLHDVVLDRGFAQNHTIYFCMPSLWTGAHAPRSPALGSSTKARPDWRQSN